MCVQVRQQLQHTEVTSPKVHDQDDRELGLFEEREREKAERPPQLGGSNSICE